jgi:hypothetical protein
MMSAFWDVAACSLVEVYVSEALTASIVVKVTAVRTAETSVYFNETIWRYIPEGCHFQKNLRQNFTFANGANAVIKVVRSQLYLRGVRICLVNDFITRDFLCGFSAEDSPASHNKEGSLRIPYSCRGRRNACNVSASSDINQI